MTEIISHPITADSSPADLLRTMLCPLCWSPPGRPCQRRPAGDHLARFVAAVNQGLLTKADLAAVVGGIEVIAEHIVIIERAA